MIREHDSDWRLRHGARTRDEGFALNEVSVTEFLEALRDRCTECMGYGCVNCLPGLVRQPGRPATADRSAAADGDRWSAAWLDPYERLLRGPEPSLARIRALDNIPVSSTALAAPYCEPARGWQPAASEHPTAVQRIIDAARPRVRGASITHTAVDEVPFPDIKVQIGSPAEPYRWWVPAEPATSSARGAKADWFIVDDPPIHHPPAALSPDPGKRARWRTSEDSVMAYDPATLDRGEGTEPDLDRLTRSELAELSGPAYAVAQVLDEWNHRENGITSSSHGVGLFLDLLAEYGHRVTPIPEPGSTLPPPAAAQAAPGLEPAYGDAVRVILHAHDGVFLGRGPLSIGIRTPDGRFRKFRHAEIARIELA